jgi:hydroxymethylglutaryl-CoA lyase
MQLPAQVKLVEVGPRDGLQNESSHVTTADKVTFINRLSATGLSAIEAGAFVSPKWIPQMADSAQVLQQIEQRGGISYPVLVPNERGLQRALEVGVKEIAVFAAASEKFSQRNINCSIAESLQRFEPVTRRALDEGLKVRGYISCVLGCPYEGDIAPQAVAHVARALDTMGCYEISLGDTIGVGTARKAQQLFATISDDIAVHRLAGHFHDTYGQALANILAVMQLGVATFDSATAGLGGCPYAKGASGNVASEDVLFMLHGLGIDTGVDLQAVADAGTFICKALGRESASKVARALQS